MQLPPVSSREGTVILYRELGTVREAGHTGAAESLRRFRDLCGSLGDRIFQVLIQRLKRGALIDQVINHFVENEVDLL